MIHPSKKRGLPRTGSTRALIIAARRTAFPKKKEFSRSARARTIKINHFISSKISPRPFDVVNAANQTDLAFVNHLFENRTFLGYLAHLVTDVRSVTASTNFAFFESRGVIDIGTSLIAVDFIEQAGQIAHLHVVARAWIGRICCDR
jgi:hypothetical protein